MAKAKKTYPVVVQDWVESERGWGQSHLGYTLHLNRTDRDAFVKFYYEQHNTAKAVPDWYVRVGGEPSVMDVSLKTYRKLKASVNGISVDDLSNL